MTALGYRAAALQGAAAGKARRKALPAWQRQLQQRVRSLTRLAQMRRVERRHPGEESGWSIVLANLAGVKFGKVDTAGMLELAIVIGLPTIDERSLAAIAGEISSRRRRLLTGAQCGALVGLTTDERTRLKIRDIDATDELAADRKRRLARQRQARRRAGAALKAAPTSPTIEDQEPWLAAGISRRTWFRRQAAERVGTGHVTRPFRDNTSSSGDTTRTRIGNRSSSVTAAVPHSEHAQSDQDLGIAPGEPAYMATNSNSHRKAGRASGPAKAKGTTRVGEAIARVTRSRPGPHPCHTPAHTPGGP